MDSSRIETKLDALTGHITDVKIEQATMKEDLRHHIKRTEVLEKRMDNFWQKALLAVSLLSGVLVMFKHVMDLAQ